MTLKQFRSFFKMAFLQQNNTHALHFGFTVYAQQPPHMIIFLTCIGVVDKSYKPDKPINWKQNCVRT